MSFYEKFVSLCEKKGVKPGRAASDCGINRSNVTSWKNNGYTPRGEVLQRLAVYFEVPVDQLLGDTENKNTPVLTKKDRRDIAKSLEEIMADLENSGDLMFDGDPMTAEAKESIRSALKLGLEAAKLKNKETYTPKKYRG